jgi:hypothetical protein
MGFSIRYCTTRSITANQANAIRQGAIDLIKGRTWLSCEPVHFFADQDDDRLSGFSKPNFNPHADDVASAAREGLPDGTVLDLLEVLRQLSCEHGVDWELSHDHSDGPFGFIRGGVCEPGLFDQIEGIAGMAETMGEFTDDQESLGFALLSSDDRDDDEGDEPPTILPFRPK